MRKFGLILAMVGVFVLQIHSLYAENAEEAKRRETAKKLETKKLELNGSEWQITVRSQSGKGSLAGPDTLTFQDGRFVSKNLGGKGYTPTNYTLTLQEEGPTVWETMQTSEKEGIVFWRGEWQEDSMSGVINKQVKEGKNEEYYFSSSGKQGIPPTSSKEETGKEETGSTLTEEKKTEPTPPPPVETSETRKKGWFS